MAVLEKSKLFNSPKLDSRIKSANTQHSERVLGYFVGPMLVFMSYFGVAGVYLTQFYTDVLQISGVFITLMPVISKVIDAITNIVMGRLIDRTRTRQGKARPWILISGVMLTITGILLYAVPKASYSIRIIWVIFSYNLFFALAFTTYNMSHILMVPLSTRNTRQRDTLALLTSTGASMIPGMLVNVIMPVLIALIGVGADAQGSWVTMMSLISILAIPAVLLVYSIAITVCAGVAQSILLAGINALGYMAPSSATEIITQSVVFSLIGTQFDTTPISAGADGRCRLPLRFSVFCIILRPAFPSPAPC